MRILCVSLLALSAIASASDHGNLDSGRPLRFEDAYGAALGAREFQLGLAGNSFSSFQTPIEFKLGYAPNRDISLGFDPVLGRTSRLDSVQLSHFQTLSGETEKSGAFALRIGADIPTSGGEKFGYEAKGIWSRWQGNDTWSHVNLEYRSQGSVVSGVVGLSRRLGFRDTMLAEAGLSSNENWIGLGMRHQLGLSHVLDFGVEHELRAKSTTLRLGITQSY